MMTSQVIRKLEARKLVARAPDPADGRARRLRLTAAGRDLMGRALADVEATDRDYFASLDSGLPTFVEALRTLGAPSPGVR